MIIFPSNSYKYIGLHCNGKIDMYVKPPEIGVVREYFEEGSPNNVLELGCGLGRVSLGFFKEFKNWQETNFWLLDGSSGDKQISGVDSSNGNYYNDLKVTHSFCCTNGIPKDQVHTINMEDEKPFRDCSLTNKFDFVYSFLAIGFHWPINWYLKRIDSFICSGTILIFGIRSDDTPKFRLFNANQICAIPDCFSVLKVVAEQAKYNFIVLRRNNE